MGDAKHTPGPWEYENVQRRHDQSAYGVVKSADGEVLFDTLNSDVGEIHTEGDGEGGVHRWDETGKRNLTLAAAAPDLLAVLLAYERWGADMLLCQEAWAGGVAEFPTLTAALWDRLLEIQAMRNAAKRKAMGE